MFEQKPEGVEDIFKDTEPAPSPQGLATAEEAPPPIESKGGFLQGKAIWAILAGFVLVVLIGGGLYLGLRGGGSAPAPEVAAPVEAETPAAPAASATPSVPETPPAAPAPEAAAPPLDTDRDGLTDAEEVASGTNPSNPDTDGDLLSDAEEIRTYRTNPLAPDTDGDTYPDGQEVKGGYNPNGPGKLIDAQLKK